MNTGVHQRKHFKKDDRDVMTPDQPLQQTSQTLTQIIPRGHLGNWALK